ncbi:hypothetical protein [Coprothermobacter platensis]|uniref:hypothetical protein n=1 Tax=Coprothermobacter platensis TaxID=108819 RepID=UPI00035EBFC4|nr:hypothetical protein [Coprothermobacter platensis]
MALSAKKAARILRIREIEEDIAKNDFFVAVSNYKKATEYAKEVGHSWMDARQAQVPNRVLSYAAYFEARKNAQQRVQGSYMMVLKKREILLQKAISRRSGEKLLEYAKEEAQTKEFKQELSLLDEIGSRKKGGES